jgi:hypothetical protein
VVTTPGTRTPCRAQQASWAILASGPSQRRMTSGRSTAQHSAPVFYFSFSFEKSRNYCKLLKYLENKIQL